jgi:hypothetical protein
VSSLVGQWYAATFKFIIRFKRLTSGALVWSILVLVLGDRARLIALANDAPWSMRTFVVTASAHLTNAELVLIRCTNIHLSFFSLCSSYLFYLFIRLFIINFK